ncbi:PspC domain-containing protein [Microbacterium sp. bgisy203]|uniref:PspC domain-containing protein n=1 Tax=Microbacterium sp. bgisy203 TaxID=3413799 RepID=UPI003D757379
MTTPVLDPGPPPTPSASPADSSGAPPAGPRPSRGDRFFSWTSGLGIVRGDGWIGGVAAGVAARLRIDPLIVRGIFVVVQLFGFPMLLVYAIAWAVLPDLDGRIPLRDAIRGQWTPAMGGIIACAVLGLVPAPVGAAIVLPAAYVSDPTIIALSIVFTVALLVAGLLVFVIASAARSPRPRSTPQTPAADPDERTASAAPLDPDRAPDASAAASGSGPDAPRADEEGDAAGFAASPSSLDPPSTESGAPSTEPTTPAEPVTPAAPVDEYAAWREQHAAWKMQDDAWRRQQQDAARLAREQARRERQERGAAFTADADERRRVRRATKPRTPFAYVAAVVGVAIVLGAIVGLAGASELSVARGLFVAALVTALGMVIAGAVRWRSGFLAFTTVLFLLGGAAGVAVPAARELHLTSYGVSNAPGAQRWPASAPFVQPWGDVTVSLRNNGEPDRPIHIEKRGGFTYVWFEPGVTLHLDLTVPAGGFQVDRDSDTQYEPVDLVEAFSATATTLPDGRVRYEGTYASDPAPSTRLSDEGIRLADPKDMIVTEQTLAIDQESGYVQIIVPRLTDTGAETPEESE